MSKPVKDSFIDNQANEQRKLASGIRQACEQIEKAMEQDGPFTHNMIGITLLGLAEKFGYKYSNDLIKQYDLTDLYGIEEIED